MNKAKSLIMLLSLLLVFGLVLSACSGDTESEEATVEPAVVEEPAAEEPAAEEPAAEEPAAEEPAAEEPAEEVAEEPAEEPMAEKPSGPLLIWAQQANQDVWEQTVLPGFLEEYPDVEVEIVNYAPDEVANQAALAIQGGTGGPDLGVTQYRDVQSLIALEGVMDISDQMAPYAGDFAEEILAYCETDGSYYCVPWDIGPTVLYFRRDIFEAAGLPTDFESVSELVSTWDGYLSVCETIMEETGLPCFPQNKANNYGLLAIDMLWQQGKGFFDEDGRVTLEDPEVVAVLEKLGEFWNAGVTSDNLDWEDPWYAELAAEMDNTDTPPVASLVYPAWMGNFFKTWIAPDQAGNWGVALMPAWEEGGARATMAGGSAYFIPKDSSNPEAAWAFIEYVNLDEDNQIAQYAYSDYFPALTTTYDDPLFSEADPYFGDQLTRAIFAEVADNVPYAYIYDSQYYNTVAGALATAVQNYALGNMSAEEALQDAANSVRLETGAS